MADQRHSHVFDVDPQNQSSPRILVRDVIKATAEHFNTPVAELLSPSRKQPLTRRRQIGMFVARKVTGRSWLFVANKFGRRDHTTARHAFLTVQARLDAGKAKAVNAIVAKIGGAR
jgi:chromosomal replication initiator protein